MNTFKILIVTIFSLSIFCIFTSSSYAQSLLCVAKTAPIKNGKADTKRLLKVVTTSACPRGYSQLLSTTSFAGATGSTGPIGSTGATGATGTAGSDGQLRIYGNGSAGALSVSGSITLPTANPQFTDCTISAGSLLIVPSGTILRCSGNVAIDGTISVDIGATGGHVITLPTANVYTSATRPAHPGRTRTSAANGEIGATGATLRGGPLTFGMGSDEASLSYYAGTYGGGGGGGSVGQGGSGAGYFAILAGGSITLGASAVISALPYDGASAGGGGGGGGFVVLASKTSITIPSSAAINVPGGNGGDSTAYSVGVSSSAGAGGGGGGGGIYIISPTNTVNTSGFNVLAGAPGSTTTQIAGSSQATAGGAGGAGVGLGGSGCDVPVSRPVTCTGASVGGDGAHYVMTADPTALF